MFEKLANIWLVINDDYVVEFRAACYEMEGGDDNKIAFLKSRAKEDYASAFHFEAPKNNKNEFMRYRKFSSLEKHGMQYQLFEEIFEKFELPDRPLICVTPVVDGKISC